MSKNPDTLLEEDEFERKRRQLYTGVLGEGHQVVCRPDAYDYEVTQVQHRAVCLTRPYQTCFSCPHAAFTLVFKSQPTDLYDVVACPRWATSEDRAEGIAPTRYVPVEVATCKQRPFAFCTSCPTTEQVEDVGADKHSSGWYGRWKRIIAGSIEETEDDDDG